MRTSHLLAFCLLASGTALADKPSIDPAREYLYLHTPEAAVTAQVTDKGLSSPQYSVDVSKDAIRGRSFGRTVDLTLKDDSIGGIFGSRPVNLKLQDTDGVMRARGSFAGQPSDLKISKQGIQGTVGRCSYDLKARPDNAYEGTRSCGRGIENPVTLTIPPSLAVKGNPTLVGSLSALMAVP